MTLQDHRQPAIRVSLMPRDTNQHGTIFGGIILSYIDQAGAIEALLHGARKVVTVCMHEVVFHEPVNVGDLVSLYATVTKMGNSSITTKVVVEAAPPGYDAQPRTVTEAEVVYVNVDDDGKPTPLPPQHRGPDAV